jgi:integrase
MSVYRPWNNGKQSKIYTSKFQYLGVSVKESTGCTLKTLADEWEKRKRRDIERAHAGLPAEAPSQRITNVAARVETYLNNFKLNHRPKSIRTSTQRLAHVKRLLGKYMLFDITEQRIHDYIRTRQQEGVSGRTINMEVGELSRAMGNKWSVLWPKVRKLEENHDIGVALEDGDEHRLLTTAAEDANPNRNPFLYTFVQFGLLTGMRNESEICAVRWLQLDFEENIVTVGKAKTRKGTGREIPMTPRLRMVLEQHAAWYAQKFGPIQPDWFVFPGGPSRAMQPDVQLLSIKTAWGNLRKQAGVKCRFHDLRHTFATKLAENDVPEPTMKSILGHMSQAMLERYSHIRRKAKRDAVAGIRLATDTENGKAASAAAGGTENSGGTESGTGESKTAVN